MTHLPHALAGTLLLAFGAGPALALTPQEEARFRDNCTGDYLQFCAMHAPDSPQVDACFRQKMQQLSPGCRTAISSFQRSNPSGRR